MSDFVPFEFERTSHPKYYADACAQKDHCSYKYYKIDYGDPGNYELRLNETYGGEDELYYYKYIGRGHYCDCYEGINLQNAN